MLIDKGRRSLVVPECCEAIKKTAQIYLDFVFDIESDECDYENHTPIWVIPWIGTEKAQAISSGDFCKYYNILKSFTISFCPYCGEKLPEIVKVPRGRKKVHKYDDDYCGTCKERCMECECYPPTVMYDVKK